jgi:phage-related protein
MVLVHGFIKKERATPDAELALARQRWADWKRANR